ncbi:MAG: Lytic transglycosylase catalytic [Firmicutes bacterium]|nr:Lytic transglycosylase catalytic [Bacillota bacterium]
MQNVQKVISRINEIQNRFQQFNSVPAGNFGEVLGKVQMQEAVGGPARQNDYGSDIPGLVRKAAAKYNVDPKLALAVAEAESNFNPNAVSSVGATGVMQLMPETAAGLGVNNIRDPKENIDGGVRYLKQLLATFNGDPRKAVAAYNAGPEAVKRYGGVPPYAETQNYVNKVLANKA